MNIIFPKEILTTIFSYTDIKCHVCHKKLSLTFFCKLKKNYFCSYECYDFI